MTTLLDNKGNGKVVDTLSEKIQPGARLSILSGCFSTYAFDALENKLSEAASLRLMIPSNGIISDEDNQTYRLPGISGSDADRRFRNSLNLPEIAAECAQWLRQKAEIKAVNQPVPQNLFHVENPDGSTVAIHGGSAFTSSGLGIVPSDGYEMNSCSTSPDQNSKLLEWFNSIWQSEESARDVKASVLSQLETIYEAKSPQSIYFLTLYNLFRDNIDDLEEDAIIKTQTGVKDTLVWDKLYRFQRDGVLGAIDKIEKYNGCIIADSVGLGKTFEALAIIKYYELRNDRVLVLCPKKLRENWTIYTVNDRRNLFAGDRFNYDVLNHTDLTRQEGRSGEINLETLNWGNYDLVVIDESHNFRNNPSRKSGLTRYSRMMQEIIRSGVKTKVLMLSATPVNSRMNDLKNQVAFITEGKDDALHQCGIASIEQTLRKAQEKFNQWLRLETEGRTSEGLLESLNFDYFKLLDLLTIARSRKHIEKYYDLSEVGAFSERAKPENIYSAIDTKNCFPELREINRDIRRLNLASYAPLKYVLKSKLPEYSRKYDMELAGGSVFTQMDREQNLIHLMRVNILKRMESSIKSFELTLNGLLKNVRHLIERIDTHDESSEIEELSIEDVELEDENFAPHLIGRKIKVLLQDVDLVLWRQELEEDEELLVKLLREAREIVPERDKKLKRLKDVIAKKCSNPINPDNRKMLIFTAFADTAEYMYKNIAPWAESNLGIHSAVVTGTGSINQSTMPGVRRDIASIISSFSPKSKERAKIDETLTDDISILISTDCLSEGQNLQDCDCVVNYDIHWNPVRIIQRFGRIDRLGSENEVIQLVNFWPNMELEEYINLEARVSGRMVLLDISATGEENIIEYSDVGKMNDLEYRRRQLQQLKNAIIDLEDLGDSISITDMTFNDFRMDLSEYLKEHPQWLEHMPPGAFAVTKVDDLLHDDIDPGAIFFLENVSGRIRTDSTYALAPYYLVWVSESGNIELNFTQTKQILDLMKNLTLGRSQPDEKAFARFNKDTRNGTDMSKYQALLRRAVNAVTGKAEEKGVESLFQPGGTVISKDSFKGIDDFEVVAYLAVFNEEAAD